MASPELAITKATLSATLFRADPTSLTRPAVEAFFPLLNNTLVQCSRPNVQKCKAWIVDNIAPSNARCVALGKFLVALSKSLVAEDDGQRPSVKRRRLHLLYLLNDVLFHQVVRLCNRKFGEVWSGVLPTLVGSVAAFDHCPKHIKKLEGLINLWQEKGYFPSESITQLRDALTNGVTENPILNLQSSATSIKLAREAPYILPSFHGDASSPWYDLPAATWLPHLVPNSSKPMVPTRIRPIQLAPGPADKRLAGAVKSLLEDVERIFSKERKWEDDPHADLGQLGERVVLDEITGDVIGGETYYGWSREFCERMRERRKKATKGSARGRSLSRSRSGSRARSDSRGRSRSYSPPSFKRPRLSSRSRSHHRSRSRTRSSRSPSQGRRRNGSYSRSRSRTRTPDRRYGGGNGSNGSNGGAPHHRPSGPRSRSPAPSSSSSRHDNITRPPPPPPPPPPQPSHAPPMPFPPIPPPIPGDFSIPPPPPVGYQGHWPPPPPPLMPPSMAGSSPQGWMPNPGMMMPHLVGGWSGIPLPPPPPPHNNHHGRGNYGGYRGRGRGGYDRGGYRGR